MWFGPHWAAGSYMPAPNTSRSLFSRLAMNQWQLCSALLLGNQCAQLCFLLSRWHLLLGYEWELNFGALRPKGPLTSPRVMTVAAIFPKLRRKHGLSSKSAFRDNGQNEVEIIWKNLSSMASVKYDWPWNKETFYTKTSYYWKNWCIVKLATVG